MNVGSGLGVAIVLAGGLVLEPPPVFGQSTQQGPSIAQIQLTEQATTAEDLLLDTVEEQPETAELFIQRQGNLTDDQQAAVRDVYTRYEADLAIAVDAYLASVNLLNNLVTPDTTSEAIAYARAQVRAYEHTVYDLLFQRTIALRNILTPQQRPQINGLLRSLLNLGTPVSTSTFPIHLIGQSADTVTAQLLAEGWQLVVRTPRTLLFDKGEQSLDLVIGDDLTVEEAVLGEL